MKLSKLFGDHGPELQAFPDPARDVRPEASQARTAILAGGCFWCTEAVFLPLDGVTGVTSGYIGGSEATANYQAVCSGTTGHAEAIAVAFDPAVISFGQLLKVFFAVAHDPTQLNRQGGDRGTQYRSAIFPADDEQRAVAEAYIAQLTEAKAFPDPIVTTVEPRAPSSRPRCTTRTSSPGTRRSPTSRRWRCPSWPSWKRPSATSSRRPPVAAGTGG